MKMRDSAKERDMTGLNHDIVEHVMPPVVQGIRSPRNSPTTGGWCSSSHPRPKGNCGLHSSHHDTHDFNPERFKDGACKHSNAFLALSLDPRACVGQAFALIEAKIALPPFSSASGFDCRHRIAGYGLPLIMVKI
ncbi:hypothetical protein SELMODRAFT_423358 [Selaginella moellendorffii]|uniref:Uncharacterized protein n=1 Tax=Selaginella moellendorffii TaxID=88036 RepID=D8SLF2_SELML|nr:hypothetical protein SELMODRAFT_423358 [Selaginella moellendorffii]